MLSKKDSLTETEKVLSHIKNYLNSFDQATKPSLELVLWTVAILSKDDEGPGLDLHTSVELLPSHIPHTCNTKHRHIQPLKLIQYIATMPLAKTLTRAKLIQEDTNINT